MPAFLARVSSRRDKVESMARSAGTRTYRIVVDGILDDSYCNAFEGMDVTRDHGRTAITGPVVDEAALAGYLHQVQELGCELVSLTIVTTDGDEVSADQLRDPAGQDDPANRPEPSP
jgi:hypothetical protein